MVRILKKFNRKSTRRSRSKAAAIALTTVMALSAAVVFTVPKAEAANGPCDEGDWAYAYIAVGNSETKDNIFSSQGSNAIDGVSYDKASNTLTLNQYKNADNYIATNMMGDDFKIRLIGENEISSIVAYGDAWGGSVTICGDGSLTVNPKKQEDYGVRLYAEGTASVLSVENTCNVTIYAGQAGKVLYTTGNLTDKVIKDNGTLQETPQYQISHPLDIARIYAKYYAHDPSTTNVVYTNGDSSYYTLTYSLNENDEITAYNLYQLTKKEALGDIYYAVKIGSYDTMPEGYTQTVLDTDISYYDAAWGSGGTSNLVINTATNEKYAMVYDYDSETGSSVYRICALNDFLGMDEQGRDEVWLVDYDNPVSVIPAASMGQDEQLPDGFKYDGEEQENVFNIEVSADKLTFTAKTDAGDNENPAPDENKNGLQQSADGNWYYYTNNNIDYNYNGLAANEYGWWKITNGTVDFNYTGMAANEYGWWYVSSGGVDGAFTGVASNSYGSWYFENGTINYNYDGEYTYVGITYIVKNGLATSLQKSSVGIDVSKHNGEIDWDAVKADGIKFAIIRVGYGNDDTDQDDVWAVRNMQECERVGIPYGVYLYSYAVNEDEANSEANHILRMLQGFNPVLGVYIDIEDTEYYNEYNIDPYSSEGRELITRIAVTVMDRVSRAGYTAGVYANWNYFQNVLIQSEIQAYKWLAWYKEDTSEVPEGDWIMWQYTSTGHVNGIEGNVDMNFWYGF